MLGHCSPERIFPDIFPGLETVLEAELGDPDHFLHRFGSDF